MPILLSVPFVLVIAGFVIIGLAATSQSQSSAWVSWLNEFGGVIGATLALGLTAATDLARWATHKLGQHFAGIEHATVSWLAGLVHYFDKVLSFAFEWPIALSQFAYWLLDVEIPKLIRALPSTAAHIIQRTVYRVQRIEHTIVQIPKLSRKQAQALIGAAVALYIAPYLYPLRWLRQHFHALTAVLPHTLPIPFGRTIANIKARLRSLERVTAGGLAIAALIAALAKLGLGFLRCGNVKKVGRRICGMDASLLDDLLLGTVAITSLLSVAEFAKELRAVEGEAIGIMGRLVKEWPS